MPSQLLHFRTLGAVFDLQLIEICLGSNGSGVGFAQCCRKGTVLLCSKSDLLLERLLCCFGIRQPLGIIILAVIALLQLGICGSQRLFILRDRIPLKLKPPLQGGKMCRKPGCGLFKALNTGSGESELALRFLNLLIDRFDIAGKVIRLKGQRHNQVAEGFTQDFSPALYSGRKVAPDLVDERAAGFFLFLLLAGIPCADAEKAQHVHAVDLAHTPAAFKKRVVGVHDKVVQRQAGAVMSVCAALVGNSSSTPVVCVCTAMRARAISCISLSTG